MVKVIRNFKRLIRMGLTVGRKAVCKRMQHCWQTTPNIVGSCCVRLYVQGRDLNNEIVYLKV